MFAWEEIRHVSNAARLCDYVHTSVLAGDNLFVIHLNADGFLVPFGVNGYESDYSLDETIEYGWLEVFEEYLGGKL